MRVGDYTSSPSQSDENIGGLPPPVHSVDTTAVDRRPRPYPHQQTTTATGMMSSQSIICRHGTVSLWISGKFQSAVSHWGGQRGTIIRRINSSEIILTRPLRTSLNFPRNFRENSTKHAGGFATPPLLTAPSHQQRRRFFRYITASEKSEKCGIEKYRCICRKTGMISYIYLIMIYLFRNKMFTFSCSLY